MKKITLSILVLFFVLEVSAQTTSFQFTEEPSNEAFFMKGKTLVVEGKQIAEYKTNDSRNIFFVKKRQDDILMTIVSLNTSGKASIIDYHYFSKSYCEDVEFEGWSNEKNALFLNNMYGTYQTESITEHLAEKETKQMNGVLIRQFASQKEMDAFKKLLKN